MPLINLIQEQRLAVKRNERKARSLFMLFAATLVASGAGYGGLAFETERLQQEESKLKAETQKLAPLTAQIDGNNKLFGDLSPRLKTLEDAQIGTERWNRILKHVSVQTPPKTWLTAIRCSSPDPEKAISISFTGIAAAQQPIGEFILRLQSSNDLEGVQLRYTQEKIVQASKGTEFEIAADIAGTAEKKASKEDKSS